MGSVCFNEYNCLTDQKIHHLDQPHGMYLSSNHGLPNDSRLLNNGSHPSQRQPSPSLTMNSTSSQPYGSFSGNRPMYPGVSSNIPGPINPSIVDSYPSQPQYPNSANFSSPMGNLPGTFPGQSLPNVSAQQSTRIDPDIVPNVVSI